MGAASIGRKKEIGSMITRKPLRTIAAATLPIVVMLFSLVACKNKKQNSKDDKKAATVKLASKSAAVKRQAANRLEVIQKIVALKRAGRIETSEAVKRSTAIGKYGRMAVPELVKQINAAPRSCSKPKPANYKGTDDHWKKYCDEKRFIHRLLWALGETKTAEAVTPLMQILKRNCPAVVNRKGCDGPICANVFTALSILGSVGKAALPTAKAVAQKSLRDGCSDEAKRAIEYLEGKKTFSWD
jgi:hypothetical protein